jgi:hypothetical protein
LAKIHQEREEESPFGGDLLSIYVILELLVTYLASPSAVMAKATVLSYPKVISESEDFVNLYIVSGKRQ